MTFAWWMDTDNVHELAWWLITRGDLVTAQDCQNFHEQPWKFEQEWHQLEDSREREAARPDWLVQS